MFSKIVSEADKVIPALKAIGGRRLIGFGIFALGLLAVFAAAAWMEARRAHSILYSGLDRGEISRIVQALKEAGIEYEIGRDGASISVANSLSARTRSILSEQGMPRSGSGGYDILDKLGSLGLTSFVQEMTRVRVIEVELAKTIQAIRGIRAARVHIVFSQQAGLRRAQQEASASVMISTDMEPNRIPVGSIKRIVAGAIPNLRPEQVSVVSDDGVLAGSESAIEGSAGKLLALEKSTSRDIRESVLRTLTPVFGAENVRVNVTARLNVEKRQSSETTFSPESRVERSVRTIKENLSSQNGAAPQATSVERNLPGERARGAEARQSNEENAKKEEITNYEVSSRTTSSESDGYVVDHIGLAVVINSTIRGASPMNLADATTQSELIDLVVAASGVRKDRGDTVKISMIPFDERERGAGERAGVIDELLVRNSDTIVPVFLWLAAAALLGMVVVRPIVKLLVSGDPGRQAKAEHLLVDQGVGTPEHVVQGGGAGEAEILQVRGPDPSDEVRRNLDVLVSRNPEEAARILQQWLRKEGSPR